MIYSTAEFLVLFIATLGSYLAIRSYGPRFWILLASSLFFYAWAGVIDTLIFVFVIFVSWGSIAAAHVFPEHKKSFIAAGIAVMALHLFFWKYASWATGQVQNYFPQFLGGKKINLPLPVGISFFTLQGIAYLVDYSRGEAGFIGLRQYFLFKSFFPQLVAGPIVRVPQLMPQLQKLRSPSREDLAAGLTLFVIGFSKKLLLADRVAPFVDKVFADYHQFGRMTLVMAILGYTVQIWADFSGYTDMGRGAARMLGFHLPENFLSPYLSRTPSEFWRRWHITLSQWIRDYIYIPLGGNKGSKFRVLSTAVLTMAISGLWHGANWTFVVWGLYHGALLVVERLLRESGLNRLFQRLFPNGVKTAILTSVMFVATCFGWLIFRADLVKAVLSIARRIVIDPLSQPIPHDWLIVPQVLAVCMLVHVIGYKNLQSGQYPFVDRVRDWLTERAPAYAQASLALVAGFGLAATAVWAVVARTETKAFIYFQF